MDVGDETDFEPVGLPEVVRPAGWPNSFCTKSGLYVRVSRVRVDGGQPSPVLAGAVALEHHARRAQFELLATPSNAP